MTISSNKRLASAAAVAAFLAGCSGATQSASSPSQAVPQSGNALQAKLHGFSPSLKPIVSLGHRSTGKSTMSPDAAGKQALMYVSNIGNGTVTVYNYNAGKNPSQMGSLSGFYFPTPGCTDNKGNVFIPDFELGTVTEYAYGASTPSQVLTGVSEPFGCSVDPKTGNLAVVEFDQGAVAIYAGATGTPTSYSVPIEIDEYTAYDNNGDLFVAGRNSSSVYQLAEASSGSTTFNLLNVTGGSIAFPGQIQWGGSYLLLGDQGSGSGSSVNQATVSGGTATITKNILLSGSGDVVGGYKRGSVPNATYAGPDYEDNAGTIFSFPGGSQSSTFSGVDYPYGAVVVQKGGKQ